MKLLNEKELQCSTAGANNTMNSFIWLLLFFLSTSSCATFLNGPSQTITLHINSTARIIHNQDTLSTQANKALLNVPRKRDSIQFQLITETGSKTISIPSKKSFAFWSNIFCNYGIGMLVDRKSPKRFAYPKDVCLTTDDIQFKRFSCPPSDGKGRINLQVSLPHLNSFYLQPALEDPITSTGFGGITLGLDYYHSKKQFINFSISGVTDFLFFIPVPVEQSGEYEVITSHYFSITNNHRIERFTVGYGLSLSKNIWDLRYANAFDPPPPTRDPVKRSSTALGLIIPTYFQLRKNFYLGLTYRPSFYRPDLDSKFRYEHLISIGFGWRIRLKK